MVEERLQGCEIKEERHGFLLEESDLFVLDPL